MGNQPSVPEIPQLVPSEKGKNRIDPRTTRVSPFSKTPRIQITEDTKDRITQISGELGNMPRANTLLQENRGKTSTSQVARFEAEIAVLEAQRREIRAVIDASGGSILQRMGSFFRRIGSDAKLQNIESELVKIRRYKFEAEKSERARERDEKKRDGGKTSVVGETHPQPNITLAIPITENTGQGNDSLIHVSHTPVDKGATIDSHKALQKALVRRVRKDARRNTASRQGSSKETTSSEHAGSNVSVADSPADQQSHLTTETQPEKLLRQRALAKIVAEQQEEMRERDLSAFRSKDRHVIFGAYYQSPEYRATIEQFTKNIHKYTSEKEVISALNGVLFADLVFLISSAMDEKSMYLSSKFVDKVYSEILFPEKNQKLSDQGAQMIKGISPPDVLRVGVTADGKAHIEEAIEITTHYTKLDNGKFMSQRMGFYRDAAIFRDVFRQRPDYSIVLPKPQREEDVALLEEYKQRGFPIADIGVDIQSLHDFSNATIKRVEKGSKHSLRLLLRGAKSERAWDTV